MVRNSAPPMALFWTHLQRWSHFHLNVCVFQNCSRGWSHFGSTFFSVQTRHTRKRVEEKMVPLSQGGGGFSKKSFLLQFFQCYSVVWTVTGSRKQVEKDFRINLLHIPLETSSNLEDRSTLSFAWENLWCHFTDMFHWSVCRDRQMVNLSCAKFHFCSMSERDSVINYLKFSFYSHLFRWEILLCCCGSPPGVIVADTLSFNAKIGLVDFWV